MMLSPLISKREVTRAWQIVRVVGRYGLIQLIPLAQATGIARLLGVRLWRRAEPRYQDLPPPVRLRLALTELGTTFIKLGQVLSARSDLLPPEYVHELATLQDNVPPAPFEEIEPIFLSAFGCSPTEAFRDFNPTPVASASIGQVYHARLHDGTDVMVKIQRPGVEALVTTDLALLRAIATLLNRDRRIERYALPALVREFSSILQDELLYTLEGYNAETLAAEMADHPKIIFPEVYWPYTDRQVLTTRRIVGVKINDLPALDAIHVDRRELAINLADSVLEQILLHGMFHGDPHPGNLLVTLDGNIAFLDTGMVGRLDRKTRETLIELAVSIFDQDIDAVLSHLQQLGVVTEIGDLPALRRDLARLITKYYFLPRQYFRLGELLQRMNSLLFEHHIRMAYEFGLMTKALFLAEGIAQLLDPQFDYNQAARPVIAEIRRRYYSPQAFFDDTVRELRGLRRQIVDLPRRVSTVISQLESGTLRVKSTDELWEQEQNLNGQRFAQLSFAVLMAGLLIASTILLAAGIGGWLYYFSLGVLLADVLLAIWLLIAQFRAGRW